MRWHGLGIALLAGILGVAAPVSAQTGQSPVYVELATDMGDIVLELYPSKAPETVDNFLDYVADYYYDGLIFHRVVDGFVIQTGGYRFDLTPAREPGEPVVNESGNGLKNRTGTVAMARHPDPDSARAQFYINLADNTNLDPAGGKPGYTVFGRVVDGMSVVEAIGRLPVRRTDRFEHLPTETVRILSARKVSPP